MDENIHPASSPDKYVTAAEKLRTPAPGAQVIPNRYVVKFKDDMVPRTSQSADVRDVATSLAAEIGLSEASIHHVYSSAISGFAATMSEKQALALAEDPAVEYIERDQVVSISQVTWGLDRTDQRNLPLDGLYVNRYGDGTGVNAYIIDTGILLTHNEFAGRMGSGFDAVTPGGNANDCNGHGTHVAGTVGGTVYGMAPGATLYPVRVLDCGGSGSYAGVIAGVDWVTDNHIAPAVANMSLGGGAFQAVDDAVTNSIAAGVTYAIAAGNSNANACNFSPARTPDALTIGATTNTDARASYSNWGSCVDMFAPGSNITAAWHTSNTATNTISGTSMASPHVAGAVATYLGAHPNATPAQVEAALKADATQGVVTNPGTNSPNLLIFVGPEDGTPPPPPPPPPVLQNGVPVTDLSASTGEWIRFTMSVPAGVAELNFTTSGGTGDADLYVKFGDEPSTSDFDCRSWSVTNNESCTFASPQAGTWHIGVRAYQSFSGVTIIGSHPTPALQNGVPIDDLSADTNDWIYFTMDVPAGASNLNFTTSGGTGDADLYVKFGSQPTTTDFDCRSWSITNNESCTFASPQTGTYHIGIRAWQAFAGVTIVGSYTVAGFPGNELEEHNLAARTGGFILRSITVPADATKLTVRLTGGTGDADLYVRFGSEPTTSVFDCRSWNWNNEEICTFEPTQAGTYHIRVEAYQSFSGVTLIGDYE